MGYRPSRNVSELGEITTQMFDKLAISPGANLEDVVARVAAITGRVIHIEPVGNRSWETLTGLTIPLGDSARVLVRRSDPRWYQFHVVLHELSHLLFEHPGCSTLPLRHPARRLAPRGRPLLARGLVFRDFEQDVDFDDLASVVEAEAEKLTQLLSIAILTPRHARDEAVFA